MREQVQEAFSEAAGDFFSPETLAALGMTSRTRRGAPAQGPVVHDYLVSNGPS